MITFPQAKINLGLNVVERRPDGYHNLETVFYPVPLCDALELNVMDADFPSATDCDLKVTGISVEGDEQRNLVVRAYHLLKAERPWTARIHAHLHKAIPTQAGMGGGSSDCASMMMMLNKMCRMDFTQEELIEIAHGLLAPLKALPVLFEVLLELLKVAFGNVFIQVLMIGSSGNSQLDRMVGVDADHIQVDTSHRTDHHISFRIHFIDKTGHTDRIKALFCHVLPVLFFFARKEHDPVVDLRVSARQMPVLVLLEVYIGVGHDQ